MNGRDGREVVLQLISAYQEEACLYEQVYEAAAEQRRVLRNGRDPARLAELVERQRRLSEDIGKIEAGIAPLRDYWERTRYTLHGGHVRDLSRSLDSLLEGLADRIHAIIELERETACELLGTPSEG